MMARAAAMTCVRDGASDGWTWAASGAPTPRMRNSETPLMDDLTTVSSARALGECRPRCRCAPRQLQLTVRPFIVCIPSAVIGYCWIAKCNDASCPSDTSLLAEVLVVLGVAAFALVDRPHTLDELDRLDPFDHLEAELILDPKPQRRPVQMVQRLVVHLVSQQSLWMQSVLDREAVVILAARETRVE